jgi:hypothetical protein
MGNDAKQYLVLVGFASLAPVPPGPLGLPAHRWSVAEYLAEESRHGGLGERVGALLGRVLGSGEAVLGAAVHFHLPFDLGGAEVLDQLVDLLERGDRILGTVQDEEAALDVLGGLRRMVAERAVYGDGADHRYAYSRELDGL